MILIFLILFVITSCSVGPSYVPPRLELAEEWKNRPPEGCDEDDGEPLVYLDYWWEVFDDCKLNEFEQVALVHNRDLFIAFERIKEARALMNRAAADFYPQLTLNPLFTNTNELIQTFGGAANPMLGNRVFRVQELLYFLPVNLSYEVDLWGRIQDRYDAAEYNWVAMQADYEAVMLNLTSSLAISFYQLRAADAQLSLLRDVIKTRQKALEINEARFDEQISTYADVTLAAEEVDSAKRLYDEIARQREVIVNQMAVLMGVNASEFCLDAYPLEGIPPCIPGGLPSEMLARRPDIREAEYLMRSQHAFVKEAYSLYFPSLTLSAATGFESPVLKYFLKGFSRYWMNGTAVDQVVFDGGKISAQFDVQVSRFEQSSGAYQRQVLRAFKEVEDAFSNIDSYRSQYELATSTVSWARKTYQLYLDRYTLGVAYYINVTDAERDLLGFQINQNALQGLRFVATIELIRALGGGWGNDE